MFRRFPARHYTFALPALTKPKGAPAALPALGFDIAAGCPPVLSPRQVELHYTRHHKAYVDKFNAVAGARFDGQTFEAIMAATVASPADKVLFNQAAQHFNHSFYWRCLAPNGTAVPAPLDAALTGAFGSVDQFKKAFEAKGLANFGSGWTWLIYNPTTTGLEIVNTNNAACPTTDGLRPLLTIDVWEHAYYKDFENKRADYLTDIWKVVNWAFVAEQLAAATK